MNFSDIAKYALRAPEVEARVRALVTKIRAAENEALAIAEAVPEAIGIVEFASGLDLINDEALAKVVAGAEKVVAGAKEVKDNVGSLINKSETV